AAGEGYAVTPPTPTPDAGRLEGGRRRDADSVKPAGADPRRHPAVAKDPPEGRPQALPVVPENIPQALKDSPRRVVWKHGEEGDTETGEGDRDKPPCQAARPERLASSTSPKTWPTYERALAAYRQGGLDGLGHVLAAKPEEPEVVVGLDLDKCRDPETGVI